MYGAMLPVMPMPMPPPSAATTAIPPPPLARSVVTAPSQHDAPDAEDEPDTKKIKIGDVELEPEEKHLAAHPGSCAITVLCPDVDGDDALNGQVLSIRVPGLDASVTDVKKMIMQATGLAVNKQKISTPALGFFKDNASLAYYNIVPGGSLTLGLKERGGRKK